MIKKLSETQRITNAEAESRYPGCRYILTDAVINDSGQVTGIMKAVSENHESYMELLDYKNTLTGSNYIGGAYSEDSLLRGQARLVFK